MRTIHDSRKEWKVHVKAKLVAKGHKITPWLEKHIDYLALLDADQFQAEINKFKEEYPDAPETRQE